MNPEITISKLDTSNQELIRKITQWYNDEWETPIDKTVSRLSNYPSDDLIFQLVLSIDGKVVASGGLYHKMNLFKPYPDFKNYGPWVGLIYTEEKHRNKGYGRMLLDQIEVEAAILNYKKIYLYTFTAESLYTKAGWQTFSTVRYKNHDTVVMEKRIGLKV